MATIYEVAETAGVSVATVSRVINDSARVSQQTRDKVLAAMEALEYRPHAIAQSLASRRTNSIGILVPELHGQFFGTMLGYVEKELRKVGKHVIVTLGHDNEEDEQDAIDFLSGRRVDAIILQVHAVSEGALADLCSGTTPVLVMNRFVSGLEGNCIGLDNEHGGYIAAKCLLERGHRHIAYISGPLWKPDVKDRLAGHRRALDEFDVPFDQRLCYEGDFREASGGEGLRALRRTGLPFSALATANDDMAAGALRAAWEDGVRVPEDLSVVGFDNVPVADYLRPRLSTVDFPMDQMGRMVVRWIIRNAYGEPGPEPEHVIEPVLVMRDSVRTLSGRPD